MAAEFAVGIDLGTTNTVVASAANAGAAVPAVFEVPQLVTPHDVERRPLFASALYAPAAAERIEDPFGDMPWALGEVARRRGAEVHGRAIVSGKSWLTHPTVDRAAPILPWGGADDVPRISPVDAAARLLAHVRRAWDADHPGAPLSEQDVVLTVPASFDEVARELSIEAARRAGLAPKLLEEPQAAFYDWMVHAGAGGVAGLLEATAGRALVLVVDVGGGTTDLSLVRVEGATRVARVAVGPHLLLGGDNMDLTLAHGCEPRLVGDGAALDAARFAQLVAACRAAKEILLGSAPPDGVPVTVLTAGASLVGGARTTRLERDEVERAVLDGFFPVVAADARPLRAGARGALIALGLPYERDVAITRHVAAFLARHLPAGEWPNAVLLNGGVFRAPRIADRLCDVLAAWRGGPIARLADTDPDLAVARGAVAYARARAGRGVRIGGGLARGYFAGVAADEGPKARAVCVVPRGAEEGAVHVARGRTFALALGRPVRFDLYASDTVDAAPGDVVDVDDDRYDRLPSLSSTLGSAGPSPGTPEENRRGARRRAQRRRYRGPRLRRDRRRSEAIPARVPAPRRCPERLPVASPRPLPLRAGCRRRSIESTRPSASRVRMPLAARRRDLLRDLERVLGARSEWPVDVGRALFDALAPNARARRRVGRSRTCLLVAGGMVAPPGIRRSARPAARLRWSRRASTNASRSLPRPAVGSSSGSRGAGSPGASTKRRRRRSAPSSTRISRPPAPARSARRSPRRRSTTRSTWRRRSSASRRRDAWNSAAGCSSEPGPIATRACGPRSGASARVSRRTRARITSSLRRWPSDGSIT